MKCFLIVQVKKRQLKRLNTDSGVPIFLSGLDAKKEAEHLRNRGTAIMTLTMQDLSNMVLAGEMREPVTTLKMTEEMQKKLHENHERYLEEYCNVEELDFEKYRDEGGYDEEGQKRFRNRCITVQQLSASGYTRSQIKHLYKLIMADFGAEKIMSMFPKETSTKQIDNFSKVF